MAISPYIHDGSGWIKAKDIYIHNGTAWRKCRQAYVHDGTAWRLFHDINVWTKLGTLTTASQIVDAAGTLYAASGNSVYSWDGSTWNLVGSAFGNPTKAITYFSGQVYVSRANAAGIYRLSGGSWVGYITGSTKPYSASSFLTFGGALYAADPIGLYAGVYKINPYTGQLATATQNANDLTDNGTNIITSTNTGIYYWNGSVWTEYGNLGVTNCVLYSGGLVYAGASTPQVWDGSTWTDMGTVSAVSDIIVSGGSIIAAGSNGVFKWDGSAWAELPIMYGVNQLLDVSGTLYAATSYGVFRYDGP